MLFVLKIISQLLFIQGMLIVNPNVLLFFIIYITIGNAYMEQQKLKKWMNELLFYIHFLSLDTSVCIVDCYIVGMLLLSYFDGPSQ